MKFFGKPKPVRPDVYQGLRLQILQGSREKLGIAPMPDRNQPWGVVMDWGVANGTATVMGLADGSASIYLSSGGGSIGGQSVELIRKAAQYAVTVAAELQPTMHTVKEFPLPTKDQVVFYVLTDAGVFGEGALSDEFKNQQHRLTKLGSAMQQIITQYRLIQK